MQPKMVLKILVLAAASVFLGVVPSKADVILTFGDLGAQTSGCTHAAGDQGLVCNSPQNFSQNGISVTATGWSGAPGTSTGTPLTFKPTSAFGGAPANALDESGLGQNTAGPGSPCDEPAHPTDCEIGDSHSVAAVSTDGSLIDALVASVQAGENFIVYVGNSLASLAPLGGPQTCGSTTCEITFSGALAVGIQSGGNGDVLLAQVSAATPTPPIPEPGSMALLGMSLLSMAWFARAKRR